MLTSEEIVYIKNTLPFWTHLTESQQNELLHIINKEQFKKDSIIYNGTDECYGLFLVQKGLLRTYILSPDGKDITLYRLWENDFCILSASCILNNISFDINIEAKESSTIFQMNSSYMSKLMEQNSYVKDFTSTLMNTRFSDVMWTLEQILFMKLDQRIAIFLYDEMVKRKTVTLSLTHADLATYIGSAREAVTRMLKYFQEEEILELSRGGIRITNPVKLKQLTIL